MLFSCFVHANIYSSFCNDKTAPRSEEEISMYSCPHLDHSTPATSNKYSHISCITNATNGFKHEVPSEWLVILHEEHKGTLFSVFFINHDLYIHYI